MARHVVLTFQSNEEAEAFVAAIQRIDSTGRSSHVIYTKPHSKLVGQFNAHGINEGVEVIGMYAKPTGFCECEHPSDKSLRGEKWGWFICPKCARPKRGVWQYPRNLIHPFKNKELLGPGKDERYVQLGVHEGYESPHTLIDLNMEQSSDKSHTA